MSPDLLQRVEQFIYREARLQDEHRYEDWEALWEDDAIYWIPANGDATDPTKEMSIAFDNRSRIGTRVRQLLSGKRHSQAPPSRLRRLVSNIELLTASEARISTEAAQAGSTDEDDLIRVAANFLVVESRRGTTQLWSGSFRYHLRDTGDELRLVRKHVHLVDNDQPLPNLAFLL